jgi:prepilin-type N-terminal cleavage/methylation domain-containing protein
MAVSEAPGTRPARWRRAASRRVAPPPGNSSRYGALLEGFPGSGPDGGRRGRDPGHRADARRVEPASSAKGLLLDTGPCGIGIVPAAPSAAPNPEDEDMRRDADERTCRRSEGFTLVEVVVVLGVVLLLAGIAVPLVNGYIEDSQRGRARYETRMLGAAIMSMYKDTAQYCSRNSAGTDNTLRVLGSGDSKPSSNPFLNNSAWNTWFLSGAYGDTMDNHLISNTPQDSEDAAYPETGEFQWRGPYLADSAPLDPWGRPYLAMVYSFHSDHATNWKKAIILSAGPDGQVDTSPSCSATTDITGDDIGFVLSQRG